MTITLGTQKEISANGQEGLGVVALTSTTSISIYDDNSGSNVLGRAVTRSAGTLTLGTEITVVAGSNMPTNSQPKLARLSDTKAICYYYDQLTINMEAVVLTVSGTTLSAGTEKVLTTDASVNNHDIAALSETAAIIAYSKNSNGDGAARILTISGTTITENAEFVYASPGTSTDNTRIIALSASKAVAIWADGDNSDRPTGEVLDISGTTITGNVEYQLAAVTVSNNRQAIEADALDSNSFIVAYMNTADDLVDAVIVDEAATVLTPGVATDIEDGTDKYYELNISGTTITLSDSVIGPDSGATGKAVAALSNARVMLTTASYIDAVDTTAAFSNWEDSGGGTVEGLALLFSADEFTIAPMTRPADIDADGTNVYIALLSGGAPILIKILADLSADGSIVYQPGGGDNIGVQCGRFDSDIVWVAGAFSGTDVIAISEDAGSTFTIKDDGTFEDVEAFVIGPDSDDRALIIGETPFPIRQTIDGGASWTTVNAAFGKTTNAVARLPKNVQEVAIGADKTGAKVITYSISSGDDPEDLTVGDFPTDADVTSVLVN